MDLPNTLEYAFSLRCQGEVNIFVFRDRYHALSCNLQSYRGHIVLRSSYALMEVGTFFLFPFFPFFLSDLVLQSKFRATFSIARTWREIKLGIMRSAIFPRIHGRWKSSRNKERGTFANGDCTQCAHVGAAIPQLVTYVPLVTGGRSRSRNPPLSPPSFRRPPAAPTFAPTPSFVRKTTALFIRRGISFEKLVGVNDDDEDDGEYG